VEVKLEEGLWHIGPSPRVISGWACKNWPKSFPKSGDSCKKFALSIHQPGGALNPISSP